MHFQFQLFEFSFCALFIMLFLLLLLRIFMQTYTPTNNLSKNDRARLKTGYKLRYFEIK